MKSLKVLLTLAALLVAVPAAADCDYEMHQAGKHVVVPAWSYAHVVVMPEESAPFPLCETEAEQTSCATTEGLECAREMQLTYAVCVGEVVCDDWVQCQLEEMHLVGDVAIGQGYSACVDLVVAMGGAY